MMSRVSSLGCPRAPALLASETGAMEVAGSTGGAGLGRSGPGQMKLQAGSHQGDRCQLVPPGSSGFPRATVMDELALERYFDDSIANDSGFMLEESLQSPSQPHLDPPQKPADDLDLSFLPDELGAQEDAGGTSQDRSLDPHLHQDSGVFTQSSADQTESWQGAPDSAATRTPTTSGPVSGTFCPMTPMTPMTPVTERSGIIPQLQNIVSTVNLGCPLNLKFIALQARNAEYNPKRFAAVIMRIREPRTTALIFSSGKMVCTGAKSEEQSRLASRKYARVVQKLGFPARFMDFKIQNMVASCDVFFPIRLEGLVLTHQQFSSYEPELFPGLIYRMVKPRIVLLIFVSGKVVLTGAKERGEIYEAFENIYPILRGFRKQ